MPRTPGGRRDDPNYGQLNANLKKTLLRKIRLYCTALDMTISEAADEAFTQWLDTKKTEVSEVVDD